MAMCNKFVRRFLEYTRVGASRCLKDWTNLRCKVTDCPRLKLVQSECRRVNLFRFTVAEALECSLVVPPFGFYFDPQLQEHFAIDECL